MEEGRASKPLLGARETPPMAEAIELRSFFSMFFCDCVRQTHQRDQKTRTAMYSLSDSSSSSSSGPALIFSISAWHLRHLAVSGTFLWVEENSLMPRVLSQPVHLSSSLGPPEQLLQKRIDVTDLSPNLAPLASRLLTLCWRLLEKAARGRKPGHLLHQALGDVSKC